MAMRETTSQMRSPKHVDFSLMNFKIWLGHSMRSNEESVKSHGIWGNRNYYHFNIFGTVEYVWHVLIKCHQLLLLWIAFKCSYFDLCRGLSLSFSSSFLFSTKFLIKKNLTFGVWVYQDTLWPEEEEKIELLLFTSTKWNGLVSHSFLISDVVAHGTFHFIILSLCLRVCVVL